MLSGSCEAIESSYGTCLRNPALDGQGGYIQYAAIGQKYMGPVITCAKTTEALNSALRSFFLRSQTLQYLDRQLLTAMKVH